MPTRLSLAAVVAGALLAALLPGATTPPSAVAGTAEQPNVVLVYVDDMRADDLRFMPFTRKALGDGAKFTDAISPHPLCCPARAELMTGQYAQNNGVHHNKGPWGGYAALRNAGEEQLTPQWFKDAGYRTAYVGKYLNGNVRGSIPGADVTDTLVRRTYSPVRYTTWNDGDPVRHRVHQTPWMAGRVSGLVDAWARTPFFITAAFTAPHSMKVGNKWGPPVPPEGYDRLRRPHRTPRSPGDPAFNERDLSDKPLDPDLADVSESHVTAWHEDRALSLYAVDDAVRDIVRTLKRRGVWDQTVLAFTSDNGYLLGEHRLTGKDQPYQQSLRVPLLVRGPGVPAGRVQTVATTVDVQVTLAALAGVVPGRTVDGINAFSAGPDRAVLIQSGASDAAWDWRGVYTTDWTYVEHTSGAVELYDRGNDPAELDNVAGRDEDPQVEQRLDVLLDRLEDCAGPGCWATLP